MYLQLQKHWNQHDKKLERHNRAISRLSAYHVWQQSILLIFTGPNVPLLFSMSHWKEKRCRTAILHANQHQNNNTVCRCDFSLSKSILMDSCRYYQPSEETDESTALWDYNGGELNLTSKLNEAPILKTTLQTLQSPEIWFNLVRYILDIYKAKQKSASQKDRQHKIHKDNQHHMKPGMNAHVKRTTVVYVVAKKRKENM